eukprot:325071-Chlamydomonas_euryale.AAC.10
MTGYDSRAAPDGRCLAVRMALRATTWGHIGASSWLSESGSRGSGGCGVGTSVVFSTPASTQPLSRAETSQHSTISPVNARSFNQPCHPRGRSHARRAPCSVRPRGPPRHRARALAPPSAVRLSRRGHHLLCDRRATRCFRLGARSRPRYAFRGVGSALACSVRRCRDACSHATIWMLLTCMPCHVRLADVGMQGPGLCCQRAALSCYAHTSGKHRLTGAGCAGEREQHVMLICLVPGVHVA